MLASSNSVQLHRALIHRFPYFSSLTLDLAVILNAKLIYKHIMQGMRYLQMVEPMGFS